MGPEGITFLRPSCTGKYAGIGVVFVFDKAKVPLASVSATPVETRGGWGGLTINQ